MIPKIYMKHEVAQLLRVEVSWIERQARMRRIPFVMLGGKYAFTEEHLAEIIRLHEHVPASVSTADGTPIGEDDRMALDAVKPARRVRRTRSVTASGGGATLRPRPVNRRA